MRSYTLTFILEGQERIILLSSYIYSPLNSTYSQLKWIITVYIYDVCITGGGRGRESQMSLMCGSIFWLSSPWNRGPTPQQPVAQPLTKLLMFCKECANCRNESKCGQKTLLVLRTSDGTNLVKLVKCPKGGGRCSTENQFQAWVSSGLFGNSPIWGPALNCVSGRDC